MENPKKIRTGQSAAPFRGRPVALPNHLAPLPLRATTNFLDDSSTVNVNLMPISLTFQ